MSEERLKAFLEAVKADAELQEKLKSAADADDVVAIAKAAGFVISADDLKQAQTEVSEEELESAAGGTAFVTVLPVAGMFIIEATRAKLMTACLPDDER